MSTAEELDLQRLRQGGETALAELFAGCQQRLERIIRFRIDPRVRGRVDAADVLQDTFLTAARRLPEFLKQPASSSFVWLRQLALQTLIDVHRREFRHRRDVGREIHLAGPGDSENTSFSIACFLIDQLTSPSQQLARAEELQQLQQALNSMNEIDREVLALRHFEQLSNLQTAEILALSPTAASNRYIRAAARLTEILQRVQTPRRKPDP
jgi:RNA polymerase sigma-70 factor (ECF subfamily)